MNSSIPKRMDARFFEIRVTGGIKLYFRKLVFPSSNSVHFKTKQFKESELFGDLF